MDMKANNSNTSNLTNTGQQNPESSTINRRNTNLLQGNINLSSTLSFLLLELLHVKFKFFSFQYVSTKMYKTIWAFRFHFQHVKHKKIKNKFIYPSARPHWPGRDEMAARRRPLENCSSTWGSSLRSS